MPRTSYSQSLGWYYRVREEGWVEIGDAVTLVERKHPDWTIERIQKYLHGNTQDLQKLLEVSVPTFFSDNITLRSK
jgi:MOSC domain-containing protein YiiM